MNGQTEILEVNTLVSKNAVYEFDSLQLAVEDSVAYSLPVFRERTKETSSIYEIYGESVVINKETIRPESEGLTGSTLSTLDISIVGFVIIAWLLLVNRYASETAKIIKGVLYPSLIKQVYEITGIHMKSCLRFTFAFTFMLFYFILVYISRLGLVYSHFSNTNIYIYIFIVLSVFFIVRFFLSSFMIKMVADTGIKKVSFYSNMYISALNYIFAPLVAALFMSYVGSVFSHLLLWLIAALLAGYYIFVARIFYTEKLPFNRFFIYLCTVEIIPLAFAVYMIFWE